MNDVFFAYTDLLIIWNESFDFRSIWLGQASCGLSEDKDTGIYPSFVFIPRRSFWCFVWNDFLQTQDSS